MIWHLCLNNLSREPVRVYVLFLCTSIVFSYGTVLLRSVAVQCIVQTVCCFCVC